MVKFVALLLNIYCEVCLHSMSTSVSCGECRSPAGEVCESR